MRVAQQTRFDAIQVWAEHVRALRLACQQSHAVHLRPSGSGIRLVDLSPERPQLDRGKITRTHDAAALMRAMLAFPATREPGRATPEKCLQSWLIADAYRNDGVLAPLGPKLRFVTDEQRFPDAEGEFVCDVLALEEVDGRTFPAAIELKSDRDMTRLIQQVDRSARLLNAHLDQYARLSSALLGTKISLVGPCRRWVVWPAPGRAGVDSRAAAFADLGIGLINYRAHESGYVFSVVAEPTAIPV